MSNETIAELRTHLFDALRGLTDKTNPMDIERAKAVCDVAQVIVNSAKVEVEHMKVSGGNGSGFIAAGPALPPSPPPPEGMAGQLGVGTGVTVRRHRLQG